MAELLVTITVIGIMMAIVFGVMQTAQQSARTAKTKATINKINAFIMAKYDSYRTRRVQLDLVQYCKSVYSIPNPRPGQDVARARLNAIRDLMRQEMPDRWSDVVMHTGGNPPSAPRGPLVKLTLSSITSPDTPALSWRYYNTYVDAWNNAGSLSDKYNVFQQNGACECLYLIVMAMPDAASQFSPDEIADTDGDGLLEFIDGWNRPIRFLRWPAGFLPPLADTNLQSDAMVPKDPANAMAGNNFLHPDPFDRRLPDPSNPRQMQFRYAIYPLIYSAGRDGKWDINIGKSGSGAASTYTYALTSERDLDPYVADPNGFLIGLPQNDDSTTSTDLRHYDNIHNQRNEVR